MKLLQDAFEQQIAKAVDQHDLDEEQISEIAQTLINDIIPEAAADIHVSLDSLGPKMLRKRRRENLKFEKRHLKIWSAGFDQLESLVAIAEEVGSNYNEEMRPNASRTNDFRFEAIISLQSKAALVANEMLSLLKTGYADGAMARWRTLHEAAVIATFLSKNGQATSERYILASRVQAYKAMMQYQNFASRANLKPYSDQELRQAQESSDQILDKYGSHMGNDYGWASEELRKPRPNLFDLEESTGLDHWRPHFKRASQHLHAPYRDAGKLLATAGQEMLLTGPSNYGLTGPAHQLAISLSLATISLLLLEPNIDRLVVSKVMLIYSDQIGQSFCAADPNLG